MNIPVTRCSTHKHLGMYLDEKLKLSHQLLKKLQKPQRVGVIKKLLNVLPRRTLPTIYKSLLDQI